MELSMQSSRRPRRAGILPMIIASAVLAACGGGGGGGTTTVAGGGAGGSGNTQTVTVVSEGVMVKGSVIVNGIHYDDSAASIRVDNSAATAARLQTGMVVRVYGESDDSRASGTALKVRSGAEVRGTVTSKDGAAVPPNFTVLGQRVTIDDSTVFANLGGVTLADRIALLALNSSYVEVHGQRDSAGRIRASRVELIGAGSSDDQIRGTVSALTATGFAVNGFAVSYSSAVVVPAGTTLANGMLVEVHGIASSGVLVATRVHPEDAQDDSFKPTGNSSKWEVEGFVSGFASHPGSFTVAGRTVRTKSSTRFENGTAADLANGVRVEAEGRSDGVSVDADKISFRSTRTILAGAATVNAAGRTLTVLGRTVRVDDHTEVRPRSGTGLAAIPTGARVEVRGALSSDGAFLLADRVEDIGTGNGGRDIVQARVSAFTQSPPSITLFGIVANLSGASQYRDVSGNAISQSAFFAALNASASSGTLVKLKGSMPAGTSTMSVEEAEIEN